MSQRNRRPMNDLRWLIGASGALLTVVACQQEMADQPRAETYEVSDFFDDGLAARPLVAGTVARGQLREDEGLYTGSEGGAFVQKFPLHVDRELLLRGRERFDIFCTPCHDAAGTGLGIVVRRGFRQPLSFHTERLRGSPPGYFFDVISKGFGTMPSYASQVPVRDRWAIVAYIRALQFSQNARDADVPPEARERLEDTAS